MKHLFVIFNSLLYLTVLLLSSCSKETKEECIKPTVGGFRPVCLRIINSSSFGNNEITLHFDLEQSHIGGYAYCYVDQTGESNDGAPYNDDGWNPLPINHWITLDKVKNNMREKNQPNFFFEGSDLFTWHQDILIGLGNSDQEKFQIKGTAAANSSDEINVWLNKWSNPNRRIKLGCSRIEVGQGRYGWSVFVDIVVRDN